LNFEADHKVLPCAWVAGGKKGKKKEGGHPPFCPGKPSRGCWKGGKRKGKKKKETPACARLNVLKRGEKGGKKRNPCLPVSMRKNFPEKKGRRKKGADIFLRREGGGEKREGGKEGFLENCKFRHVARKKRGGAFDLVRGGPWRSPKVTGGRGGGKGEGGDRVPPPIAKEGPNSLEKKKRKETFAIDCKGH